MKPKEIRELTDEELRQKVDDLSESLFRLRFRLSLGEVDVVKKLRQEKKDLARVKTILRERQSNVQRQ